LLAAERDGVQRNCVSYHKCCSCKRKRKVAARGKCACTTAFAMTHLHPPATVHSLYGSPAGPIAVPPAAASAAALGDCGPQLSHALCSRCCWALLSAAGAADWDCSNLWCLTSCAQLHGVVANALVAGCAALRAAADSGQQKPWVLQGSALQRRATTKLCALGARC
jgi:hypothetical protein